MANLSDRLKDLLEENDLDQKEFAKIMHLSQQTISGYVTGYRIPNDNIKIKIADFFNVSLDFLMGKTNIRNSNIEIDEETAIIAIAKKKNIEPERLKEIFNLVDKIIRSYPIQEGTNKKD